MKRWLIVLGGALFAAGQHNAISPVLTRLFAAALTLSLALPEPARADGLHRISGSPYTSAACSSSGIDGEVALAVDPSRPAHMVASWMQDAQGLGNSSLGTTIVLTASSEDGGATWSPSTLPAGSTLCSQSPGANQGLFADFDESISVGPDGRWYLAMFSNTDGFVSTSQDGSDWNTPPAPLVNVDPPPGFDDLATVVADPLSGGRAYVAWRHFIGLTTTSVEIATTLDGGKTFSAPTTAVRSHPGTLLTFARLVGLSDGSLLDVYSETSTSSFLSCFGFLPGQCQLSVYATRGVLSASGVCGISVLSTCWSWSAPVQIGSYTVAGVVDQNGKSYTANTNTLFLSVAAGPGGTAYVAWVANTTPVSGDVHIAGSSDQGAIWSTLADLPRPSHAFEPAIAASGSGTLAVMWYDFSGLQPPGMVRPTTLWLARSDNGGVAWQIEPLAGPFDLNTAAGLTAFGDYQALVASGSHFVAAFTLSSPQAVDGPTDVFAAAF